VRYQLFGRGTGLRVSELCLGTALFGTSWGYGAAFDEARRIFDTYVDAGGNFIDTADSYQFGDAETMLGDLLAGRRDQITLASKYTLGAHAAPHVGTTGNSRKNLVQSIEASLKRLRTDRIDLYWVHMADGVTSSEEIMRGLDDLVRAGKILYIGLSDFPAWRAARAATIAEIRGWAPVAGIQTQYSLAERTSDRELLPMAQALGLGIAVWSPLAGGLLTGKYRRGEPGRATTFGAVVHHEDTPRATAILDALETIARDVSATPAQVALSWLRTRDVLPVIGPRTREQLIDNLGAVTLGLDPVQIDLLDRASAITHGFPHDFLAEPAQALVTAGGDPGAIAWPATPVA